MKLEAYLSISSFQHLSLEQSRIQYVKIAYGAGTITSVLVFCYLLILFSCASCKHRLSFFSSLCIYTCLVVSSGIIRMLEFLVLNRRVDVFLFFFVILTFRQY